MRLILSFAISLLGPLLFSSAVIASEEKLPAMDLQSSDGKTLQAAVPDPQKSGRMTGELPTGWRDDSGWADVAGSYLPREFEGVRYLRVQVDEVRRGFVQVVAPLPATVANHPWQVRLSARGDRPTTMALQIVERGQPYKVYWRQEVRVGNDFEEFTLEVPQLPAMQPSQFMLQFPSAVAVEIRHLFFETPAEAPPASEVTTQASKNLLGVSRFPLGPQTGMSLHREFSDDVVEWRADPLTFGPSGVPALLADSVEDRAMIFDSGLLAIQQRRQPHVASVWIKGDGQLILSAMAARDNDVKVEKERFFRIRPNNGWQRAVLDWVPPGDSANQFLRFSVKGRIWIDALMVTPGAEEVAFDGQQDCEVAMALSDGDAVAAGVQFADEPALIRWAVSGRGGNLTLKVRVTSAMGTNAELDPIPLGQGFLQFGELNYAALPNEELGAFRIEAVAVNANNEPVSPISELVVLRTERPKFWGVDAPQSYFGQHLNPTNRHILMAKALGTNWARLHTIGGWITEWVFVEPNEGEWKWADSDLAKYRAGKLSILGMLSTAPRWASYLRDTDTTGPGGYFGQFFLPKDPSQFGNYCRTVAERYRDHIRDYEVWNEPWQTRWFGVAFVDDNGRRRIVTPEHPQQRYVDLVRTAFEAVRTVDPEITVVGLNSTSTRESRPGPDGVIDGTNWTAGVLKAGGLKFSDVASFHDYTTDPNGFPDDAVTRGVKTALGPNEQFPRVDQTAWMTEGSSTVGGRVRFGMSKNSLPYRNTEDIPALTESVLRYDVSMIANGVQKVILYSMADYMQGTPGRFRSFVNMDGSSHPSALGRASLAWHVDGLAFSEMLTLSEGVTAYLFEGDGRAVAVVCPAPNHAGYQFPSSPLITLRDLWLNPLPPGAELLEHTCFVSMAGTGSQLKALLLKSEPTKKTP